MSDEHQHAQSEPDPLERAAAAHHLLAMGDGLSRALLRNQPPRLTAGTLSPVYSETMDAARHAVGQFAHLLSMFEAERRTLRTAGELTDEMQKRHLKNLWDERAKHNAEAKGVYAELKADGEQFRLEHGAVGWWEECDLRFGHMGLLMQYEIATHGIVSAFEGFERYCVQILSADPQAVLRDHLEDASDSLWATVMQAIKEHRCADEPRWLDALEMHAPFWAPVPESQRRVMSPEELSEREALCRDVMGRLTVSADEAFNLFAGQSTPR